MNILAIETSCDETSLAILSAIETENGTDFVVYAHNTLSQIDIHAQYGGVFPNLAKREHAKNLVPLLEVTLREAKMYKQTFDITKEEIGSDISCRLQENNEILKKLLEHEPELYEVLMVFLPTIRKPNIDMIVVTHGPGLEPALWVGVNFAQVLSFVWNIPVIPVNHMEGHIVSASIHGNNFSIDKSKKIFPMLALLISGGHTELVITHAWGEYEKIGQTLDDAVGEAYDKVARLLGLPYPGGPKISQLAETYFYSLPEVRKYDKKIQFFPRPMIKSDNYDFSFSGLKSAVRRYVETTHPDLLNREQVAYEFQEAVTDVLVEKTRKALKNYNIPTLAIAGGVAANKRIRSACESLIKEEFHNTNIMIADMSLTGDNALMIGVAGYLSFLAKKSNLKNDSPLLANGNLSL